MSEPLPSTAELPRSGSLARPNRSIAAYFATLTLNLLVTKPIATFVWWLSSWRNRSHFRDRAALRHRVADARRSGRPVLFASNHSSMFDDPIIPMSLFRTGPRAALELAALGLLIALHYASPLTSLPPELPGVAAAIWAVGCAHFGAQKTWWSLGDLVNFSGSDALRAKLMTGRERPLSRLQRGLLAAADPTIFFLMRSAAVKTVFVDRRPGDEAKATRARAVALTVEYAARAEPVWIFFEGSRARTPGEIGAARRGIGDVYLGLRRRGLDPLVIAIHQRGLEKVIPRGSRHWLSNGHLIEVSWSECALDPPRIGERPDDEARLLANSVRAAVVRLSVADSEAREADA